MSNQLNDQMPAPAQVPPTDPQPSPPPLPPARPAVVPPLRLVLSAPAPAAVPEAEAGIPARALDSAVGPLVLRALTPADGAAHADFLLGLGEHGRRMRRFALPRGAGGTGRGRALTMVLAEADGVPAASGSGRVLGELCVCIDARGVAAEFALAVRAEMQGRGLGRLLAAALLDLCRARRVVLVCASVPAGNTAMLALARGCGFQALRAADGSAQLALMLRPRGVR